MPNAEPVPALSGPNAPEPPNPYWQSFLSWTPSRGPLPAEIDEAALDAIAAYVRAMQRPATNKEVIGAVRRLRLHYGEWLEFTKDEEAEIWRDWLLDFRSYPKHLLDRACSEWRNSTAKKPPTAGQLKDKVKGELSRLTWVEAMLPRARAALNDPERMWR